MTTIRPTDQEPVNIDTAARVLGITREAVRLRIRRGTLVAEKWEGHWVVWPGRSLHVVGPDQPTNRPEPRASRRNARRAIPEDLTAVTVSGKDREITRLEETVRLLTVELEARRRETAELHVLLQRSQGSVALPLGRVDHAPDRPTDRPTMPRLPWWRRVLAALTDAP